MKPRIDPSISGKILLNGTYVSDHQRIVTAPLIMGIAIVFATVYLNEFASPINTSAGDSLDKMLTTVSLRDDRWERNRVIVILVLVNCDHCKTG